MASWIFWTITIIVVVALFLFYKEKFKHMKTKTIILIILIFLIFFYYTGSKIIKEHNVDIKSFKGIFTAAKLYFSWLTNAFDNTKTIAGNAVKMNWGSNSTG